MKTPTSIAMPAALALLASLSLAPVHAEPLNVKLGLWETTQSASISGAAIPEAALSRMSPEQRERMAAMLKRYQDKGPQSFSARSCLTKDKLDQAFTDRKDSAPAGCTHTLVSATSTVQEYKIQCSKPEERTGSMKLEAVSPEYVKGAINMNSSRGAVNVAFEGRWLGADCGKDKE